MRTRGVDEVDAEGARDTSPSPLARTSDTSTPAQDSLSLSGAPPKGAEYDGIASDELRGRFDPPKEVMDLGVLDEARRSSNDLENRPREGMQPIGQQRTADIYQAIQANPIFGKDREYE